MSALATMALSLNGGAGLAFADADRQFPKVRPLQRPVDCHRSQTISEVAERRQKHEVVKSVSVHGEHHAGETGMQSVEQFTPRAAEVFTRRFAAALARRVGPGCGMAVKQAAHEFGVSESLIYQWLAGEKMPSGPRMMHAFALFGPSFSDDVLRPLGQSVASLADNQAMARAERARGLAAAWRTIAEACPDFGDEESAA